MTPRTRYFPHFFVNLSFYFLIRSRDFFHFCVDLSTSCLIKKEFLGKCITHFELLCPDSWVLDKNWKIWFNWFFKLCIDGQTNWDNFMLCFYSFLLDGGLKVVVFLDHIIWFTRRQWNNIKKLNVSKSSVYHLLTVKNYSHWNLQKSWKKCST